MKRLIPLMLAVLMLLTFVGCDLDLNYAEKLTGTWIARAEMDDEAKENLMDAIELYDEEKQLVDTPLYTAEVIVFEDDGSYYFAEDPDGVKEYVKQFFEGMFTDLYEGRAELTNCYEIDVSQLSEDEFYAFYAEMYGYSTLEEMLESLSSKIYDYDSFGPTETGEFKATYKVISFDSDDDEMDGDAEYKLDDDELTITFIDVEKTYTKAD